MEQDKTLTVKEISEELNVNNYQVYRLIESGQLKAFNISQGKQRTYYRVYRKDLDEFIQGRMIKK